MSLKAGQPSKSSLHDVARAAGVSVATVSRVLNGTNKERWASAAARANRIRSIAKELGYVPDLRARALRIGKTNSIAVVYSGNNPMLYAESYMPVFGSFGEIIQAAGYHILFIDVPSTSEGDLPVSVLRSVEAAVFFHKVNEVALAASRLVQGPSLLINCDAQLPAAKVNADDHGGATALAEHLLQLGHRRICFVDTCRPGANFDHFSRLIRRQAVEQTMNAAGMGRGFAYWEYDVEVPANEIVARYKQTPARARPTAVVFPYGIAGLLLLNAFIRAGVRIPAELSFATFDDHYLIAGAVVPLTTVHIPMGEMGRKGGELILSQLRGSTPHRSRKITLPERLIVRQSTARAPRPRG